MRRRVVGCRSVAGSRSSNPPEASQEPISVFAQPSASALRVVQADAGQVATPNAKPTADAATAPAAAPSLASQYVVKGVMITDGNREAIVVGPHGESMNLKKGATLPGTHARVLAVDEGGVTLEDRAPDGNGPPTQVRLNR